MYTTEEEIQINQIAQELLQQNEAEVDPSAIDALKKVLNYLDWKYYVQDNPILADVEYDKLFRMLKQVEASYPELVRADSPTQRVAKGISTSFNTVLHYVPMLSLENSYNADDLREWDRKCKVFAKKEVIEYTVEPKYDGAGISVYYEEDHLERAATRGDGIQGEDITNNSKQIKSIPLSAKLSEKNVASLEIRGEVIIRKDTFKAFNEKRIAEGLSILANPRNAASGSLRMLDAAEVAKRGLHAVLYNISYHTNINNAEDNRVLQSHYDTLKWLDSMGFATPTGDMLRTSSIDEVIAYCDAYEAKRDELPFEIDGMVVKVNQLADQETMGQTSHHPRWAIAYKFKARQATSKLLKVEYQVGRTGNIGPVAKIQPVPIGGVTVSSVSLFNEDVIREKDLRIGDTVLVERAGDVIPYIVKPLAELRDGSETAIVFPSHCPVCDDALFKAEGEAAWRCVNINCAAQVVERLIHFASKDAMDIRNLGDANINRFYELGFIKSVEGIYQLDFDAIAQLDKFGAKSIENLKAAIEKSKTQPLYRLVYGLGIRFVGETTAKTLAKSVTHLLDFITWDEARLCTLEDIGPKVASAVVQFFRNEDNIRLIEHLGALGVNVENKHQATDTSAGALNGKTFLFTGTLSQFKRSEAEAMVEAKGGKLLSGVSSKLNYLIVGADAGSKLEKAKKLNTVIVLTEAEFSDLIHTIA
ncbi:DNA ligase (NAD(+)) LigA [Taibaiella sp. KBW10]|uniref:NAD-dependent DNA ligase LigA n=1 Tax=Taibaiella sp. KBW10 TaxID=2153357 RepID=UPI000F59C162|nr:NAD-dependent DNA ligase LigA [Taibaiella sp. KBW10]RQO30243.1 DNA ligase (NAD(+)) LigA [Taibaiella sp. KBW10]